METIFIFIWVIAAFVSWSFWEAYIEGKSPWAAKSCGWKLKIAKRVTLTAYHFWLNIMFIFFLTLPFIVSGWDKNLFGIILSAAAIGMLVEDFLWYVINPFFSLKKFNPKDAKWYPWVGIGKLKLPATYILGIIVALLSWYFLWR
jgi:hypothetical protein